MSRKFESYRRRRRWAMVLAMGDGVGGGATAGGGGGRNKITPLEEKRVVALVRKFPEWHCHRVAYYLERTSKVFIGKTKVAEIMKAYGLNHPFCAGGAWTAQPLIAR